MSDLSQQLFDMAVSMNRVSAAALGITAPAKYIGQTDVEAAPAPRMRQLDVRDDHLLELLAGIGDLILSRRRAGLPAGLAAEEMLAVLTQMVRS